MLSQMANIEAEIQVIPTANELIVNIFIFLFHVERTDYLEIDHGRTI
jgi:hypothetical protein